jgi:hypothetical protein
MATAGEAWRSIRQLRSSPPGLAGDRLERRSVFQAALAQAEELWDAAVVAGAASRPLPLFYSVSQAGRAVCAAWATEPEWRPASHGLERRECDDPDPARRVFEYAALVTEAPSGAYAMVAAATRSPVFSGAASVADLWASIPGLPTPRAIFGDRPGCLTLEAAPLTNDTRSLAQRVAAPKAAVLRFTSTPAEELPALYPTIQRVQPTESRTTSLGRIETIYTFPDHRGEPRPLTEIGERPHDDDGFSVFVVRPRIGTAPTPPPSVFLTLWALLWCLSELARYYPDTWVTTLDPNTSHSAVTLEHGLDVALERVPPLIADALRGPATAHFVDQARQRRLETEAILGPRPTPTKMHEQDANPDQIA